MMFVSGHFRDFLHICSCLDLLLQKLIKIFIYIGILNLADAREKIILNPSDPKYLWMDELIEKDFKKLKKFSSKDYNFSVATHVNGGWPVEFVILNNSVNGPESTCKHLLQYLCDCYGLPDTRLIYVNQDGLFSIPKGEVPIFCGARTIGTRNSILFADWYFDITNNNVDWNLLIEQVDDARNSISWDRKIEKAFWRGSGTDMWSGGNYSVDNWFLHARGRACQLSQIFPDLIDAAFTHFHSWLVTPGQLERLQEIVPMAPIASIEQHLDYKYQLQITGFMANFPRDRWQFYSGNVVFRHDPPHEMFWYSLLVPWKHYIPVKSDLSDLVEKIQWAKDHDQDCQNMAIEARKFAEEHFMPEHIALYCYKAIMRYATLWR